MPSRAWALHRVSTKNKISIITRVSIIFIIISISLYETKSEVQSEAKRMNNFFHTPNRSADVDRSATDAAWVCGLPLSNTSFVYPVHKTCVISAPVVISETMHASDS